MFYIMHYTLNQLNVLLLRITYLTAYFQFPPFVYKNWLYLLQQDRVRHLYYTACDRQKVHWQGRCWLTVGQSLDTIAQRRLSIRPAFRLCYAVWTNSQTSQTASIFRMFFSAVYSRSSNTNLCSFYFSKNDLFDHIHLSDISQQTWDVGPTLVYCWPNVYDVGPTANQR